jgi:phosphatidylserine/phosphatidylglycerophosphate/cardiolipin synthase-like enzyme
VVDFAVYQGREVFRRLAEVMVGRLGLRVRPFLDVQRQPADSSMNVEVVRRFAERFRAQEWPEGRLPELYYNPRSLHPEGEKRSSLHTKCIVVDRRVALVASANLTEAAKSRNIEGDALVRCQRFAAHLVGHFEALADAGLLGRIADPPSAQGDVGVTALGRAVLRAAETEDINARLPADEPGRELEGG